MWLNENMCSDFIAPELASPEHFVGNIDFEG
jgi:hypothetical protein